MFLTILSAIGLVIYVIVGCLFLKVMIEDKRLPRLFFLIPLYLFSIGISCGLILFTRGTNLAIAASWFNFVAAITAAIISVVSLSKSGETDFFFWFGCLSSAHLTITWLLIFLR